MSSSRSPLPRDRRVRAACLFAFVLLLAPASTRAESEPDFQAWNQVLLEGNLDGSVRGLRLSLDIHVRRMNAPLHRPMGATEFQENPNTLLILRPAVGYALNGWASVWLGYAWTPDFFDDPALRSARNISEHRIWEQLIASWNLGRVGLGTRTRLEQRVRTNGPGSAENDGGYSHWAHRLRQQVRVSVTLRDGSPWQLVVADELFIHFNRTQYPSRPGFDQNRAFVGVAYATPNHRYEIGYLSQYVHRYTDPHQVNHVFSVNGIFKLGSAPAPAPTSVDQTDAPVESTDATDGTDTREPDAAD